MSVVILWTANHPSLTSVSYMSALGVPLPPPPPPPLHSPLQHPQWIWSRKRNSSDSMQTIFPHEYILILPPPLLFIVWVLSLKIPVKLWLKNSLKTVNNGNNIFLNTRVLSVSLMLNRRRRVSTFESP